mgnify:CR=1 FL=1
MPLVQDRDRTILRLTTLVACCALGLALAACAGAPPHSTPPAGGSHADAAREASESPSPPGEATASTEASSPTPDASKSARRAPRPAADSLPDGLAPLGEAERSELAERCKAFVSAVTQAGKKAGRSKGSIEIALEVLANPPKPPGVDAERCASLMKRDLLAYRARTIEAEAMLTLKQLAFAMSDAFSRQGSLCPSAPAVPSALELLAKEPYASSPQDWQSAGWRCLGFTISPPQRFQYELRSDPSAGSYEIVARGFPVDGGPPAELYVRGEVESGQLSPSQEILRR